MCTIIRVDELVCRSCDGTKFGKVSFHPQIVEKKAEYWIASLECCDCGCVHLVELHKEELYIEFEEVEVDPEFLDHECETEVGQQCDFCGRTRIE